jgi:CIC family chloride channel protein
MVSDLYAASGDAVDDRIATLAQAADTFLLPDMNVREALDLFETSETDALAVVDSPTSRRPIGMLTEAHALRRYGEELERRNREFMLR